MNRSSKFNFFLPQNTDPIDVSDFNSNFETIDANLLTKAQSLTDAQKAAVRANVDLNVANNLTTTEAGSVLDARQGKALNDSVGDLNSKVSALGSTVGGTISGSVNVPNGTITDVANITLTSGTWVIIACLDWEGNAAGYRQLQLSGASLNPTRNTAVTTIPMQDASKQTYQQLVYLYKTSTGTTLTFAGVQTSGVTLACFPYVWAVKVGN